MSHVRNAQREETPFLQQVGNGEQHWAWKVGLRAGMCILDIIGIGCAGWITALAVNRNSSLGYSDGFSDDGFLIPWALIPVSSLNLDSFKHLLITSRWACLSSGVSSAF